VLRTASASIWRSSAFVFDGFRVMDACQRAISVTANISQTGCLRIIHVGYGAYNGLKSDTAPCPKVPGSEVAIHGSEQRLSDPHNTILRRYSETHRRAVSHFIR
jgi:hypothetical protein